MILTEAEHIRSRHQLRVQVPPSRTRRRYLSSVLSERPTGRLPASAPRVVESAPDEVSTLVFAGELPDEELFEDDDVHRQKLATMGCYAGPVDAGTRA